MSEYRIAHIADTHINAARRPDDTRAVLAAFCLQAREREVDLIVHAGDFFHKKSTPEERNLLADFLTAAASIAPVVGVRGNHDMDGDLDLFGRLDTRHGVTIQTSPGWVSEGPFDVYCLPWFSKSHLLAGMDPAEAGDATATAIRAAVALLDTVRAQARPRSEQGRIPILLSHCMVAGSETSTGQTLIGQTVELSPSDLRDSGCEYIALGHIHKRQGWYGNVWYSGGAERTNFGEPEEKSWTLATFRNGRFSEVQHVALPARKIVLIEADHTQEITESPATVIAAGDLVRYRYTVRPEELHLVDEDAIRQSLIAEGAHDVKMEAVLAHTDRVRCEEIVQAATVWEKLTAFWAAKGIDVDEPTRQRIREKLDSLDSVSLEVAA